jgi:hypothetical protein
MSDYLLMRICFQNAKKSLFGCVLLIKKAEKAFKSRKGSSIEYYMSKR